jgi:hypothetical protein
MDGSRSVRVVINAREFYKRADGSEFTPRLELRCEVAKSGKQSVDAILETGGVWTISETSTATYPRNTITGAVDTSTQTIESSPSYLKTKFDEGKIEKNVWRMDPDKNHLRFVTPGLIQRG